MTKVYNGANAKIIIKDPVTGEEKLIGLVKNVTFGGPSSYSPVYTLDKPTYSPRIFINGEEQS